jgi:UPF0755 protein
MTVGVIVSLLVFKEGALPVDRQNTTQEIFVIEPGASLNTVVDRLHQQGFIRNRIVFYILSRKMNIEKQIQAGDFRLSKSMSAEEIAQKLTQGSLDEWVTVIEGLRKEEIAKIVSDSFEISEADFNQAAEEGYLFPDTYLIPKEATLDTILSVFKNNFDTKYTTEIAQKAARLGLSQKEVMTLASIVEKEGRGDDRRVVASVLLRRYKESYPLQADATVQYALGYQSDQATWWKQSLTLEDLKYNSIYNTYVNDSLPPHPICNPGVSSIEAVVNADPNTPYFYYLHEPNGRVHPARDLDEHEENIRKYLN